MGRKIERARTFRRTMTNGERVILRDHRFRDVKFRRQHPVGPFILDFYSPSLRLAVEIDGAAHLDEEQRLDDARRDRYLACHGIAIVRIWGDLMREDPTSVADQIAAAVEKAGRRPDEGSP